MKRAATDGAVRITSAVCSSEDSVRYIEVPETWLELLQELAALSNATVDEGDPSLLGGFRDDARRLVRNYRRRNKAVTAMPAKDRTRPQPPTEA